MLKLTQKQIRIGVVGLALVGFMLVGSIVAAYFLTPRLAHYKPEIVHALSDALGVPVTIDAMQAKWQGLYPVVDLQGVTIWNVAQDKSLLSLEKLHVSLSTWDLLFKQKVMTTRIMIDNVKASLIQKPDQTFTLEGLPQSAGNSTDFSEILNHVAHQDQIEVSNVSLDLYLLQGKHLEVKNIVGQLKQAWGKIDFQLDGTLLDPTHQPPVRGIIALTGQLDPDDLLPKNWQGHVNIALEQMDLPTWMGLFPQLPVNVESGSGRVAVKSVWSAGKLDVLETSLALEKITLTVPELTGLPTIPQWTDAKISGDMEWQKQTEGWQVIGKDISLTRDSIYVPPTNFKVIYKVQNAAAPTWQERLASGDYSIQFDRVDLAVVEKILRTSPLLQQQLPHWWPAGLSGKLENVVAEIDQITNENPNINLTASFNNLGLNYQENIGLGFQGFTGTINVTPTTGKLVIDSQQLQLQAPKFFTVGIELPKLSSNINWEKTSEGWLFTGNGRSELFEQGTVDLSGKFLLLPEIKKSHVELFVEANNIPVVPASAMYMPRPILPAPTVKWLDLALKQGTIQHATLELEGNLKDFPFADPVTEQAGKFEVNVHATDAELKFHPAWPAITQLEGQLLFRGKSFYANIIKGQIGGENIEQAVVSIPAISLKGLDVNIIGKVIGDAKNVNIFLEQTPLWGVLKDRLSPFALSGPATIDLSLDLPIAQPGKKYQLSGAVDFNNTNVNITAIDLPFTNVLGQLHFNEKGIYADHLNGKLYGQPATVHLATQTQTGAPNFLTMKMEGSLDIKSIQQRYPNSILNGWQGITPFTADLKWRSKNDKTKSLLLIKSPLSGLMMNLPAPLGKTAAQSRPLTVTTIFEDKQQNIKVQYDNALIADFFIGDQQGKVGLLRGTLAIQSKADIPMPKSGLQIIANTAAVDIKGNVSIPSDLKNSPIDINLSYLDFKSQPSEIAKQDIPFPPQNFPNFNVKVDHLLLNDQVLGALTLNTKMQKDALAINSIKVTNPSYSVSAAGRWENGKMQTKSYFQGTVTTKNLGLMLKTVQLSDAMTNGSGKTKLDLNWIGSPYMWSLNSLDGTMDIQWANGHLAKVKPGLGRILSLLNVGSLSKRLRLDFNDVIKKGFTFDTLTSDVSFAQGVISTNNGKVKSSSGEMDFNGNAYSTNKTLDMYLTVKPSLTGTIPIAATIASGGNPLVGALALALDKAITPRVTDGLVGIHYHVTGNWDDPQIVKGK